jgi:sulfite exporter TauE/SafE
MCSPSDANQNEDDRRMADMGTLSIAAVTLGFVHCVGGPDHYIPFVAMSRVGLWSLRKTVVVTVLCGIGHILGSAALGLLGIAVGLIILQLEKDNSFIAQAELMRGDLAACLLVVFGLTYFAWGIYYAIRKRRKTETESNTEVLEHAEEKSKSIASRAGRFTPWVLFTIFLFGPCEPLIPLMMYPAARANVMNALWIAFLFGATTVITMTAIVVVIYLGSSFLRFRWAEIYGHAVAGFVVLLCGVAVLLGL